jgi:outer membrane protein assembly factor BamB
MQQKDYVILVGSIAALCLTAYFALRRPAAPAEKEPWPAPKGDVVQWTFRTPDAPPSGIALGRDGTVYFAAQDAMYALSSGGKLVWKAALPAGPMTAAPVVAPDGTIYGASASGTLFQLDAGGKLLWSSTTPTRGIPSSPALSNDGMLFAANGYADLYAFAPRLQPEATWNLVTLRAGETKQELLLGYTGNAWERASPAVGANNTIYLPHQEWLYDITYDGEILWFVQLSSGHLGSAAIGPDGTVYVQGNTPPWLFAVDRDGKLKWQKRINGATGSGSPAIDRDGNIYICDSSVVQAFDPAGQLKWYTVGGCNSGPALAADGMLYLGTNDYGNFRKARFAALTPDGKVKWEIKVPGFVRDAPAISPSGTIYFTVDDEITHASYVYAVRDTGAGPMESSWPRFQHDAQNTGTLSVYAK